MISTDFTELNDSLKTFILSVAVGPQKVIDSLLETSKRHLDQLEHLSKDQQNFDLHFDCSIRILTSVYTCLRYINYNSVNMLSDESICPLDSDLTVIENRFKVVLDRFKKSGQEV